MIDKRMTSVTEAVADIKDGSSVLVSGFGGAGSPIDLLHALLDQGVYLAPSAFEAGFVSAAHDVAAVEHTLAAADEAFAAL